MKNLDIVTVLALIIVFAFCCFLCKICFYKGYCAACNDLLVKGIYNKEIVITNTDLKSSLSTNIEK